MDSGEEKQVVGVDQDVVVAHKYRKRFALVLLEVFAVLVLLVALGVSFGVWRLSGGPIDIGFAKSSIQEALYDPQTGMHVDFDQALLQWPDLQGPILIGLSGGRVYNRDNKLVVGIASAALSLNKTQLLLGRIAPEGIILNKPAVLLKRAVDNSISIGLTSGLADDAAEVSSTQQVSLKSILDVFGKSAEDDGDNGRLSSLNLVRIQDARVLIDDSVLSRSWRVPRLDVSLIREEDGLRSRFDIDLPRLAGVPESIVPNIEGDVFAGWGSKQLLVEAVLSQFHVKFLSEKIPELAVLAKYDVRLDAKVNAVLDDAFSLQKANAVVFSKSGSLHIDEFSQEDLAYEDFGVEASYDAKKRDVEVPLLQVRVGGVDINGHASVIHADGGFGSGFEATGRVEIPAVEHSQIAALWPEALKEDKAKEWLVDKISKGVFANLYGDFSVVGVPQDGDDLSVDFARLQAGFDFENLDVKYKETLPPAISGKGKGSFDYKTETLRIDLKSARILDLVAADSTLEFSKIIEAGAGQADLTLGLNGPLQSALRYIKNEPIGVDLKTDIDQVRGNMDAKVHLQFPTKDDLLVEEVKLDISGSMNDVFVPKIVKNLPLGGGPFQILVKDNVFNVKGKGTLAGRPVTLDYREFINSKGQAYTSKVAANLIADDDLRTQFGMDLSDIIEGAAAVNVEYTKKSDGGAVADVSADITQARLFFDPMNYQKPVGQEGQVSLKAHLKNDDLIELTDLKLTAPGAVLEPSTLTFRDKAGETELSGGKISRFSVGETVGRMEFSILESGFLKIAMDGAFLDLRPFLSDDEEDKNKPYTSPPMEISLAVDAMRTSDDSTVQYGKFYANIDDKGQFNQLEFDAIAGAGDLYVRYKPDESGKRVFKLEADDAGATLKAFEVYDNIIGGKLMIYGQPVRGVFDRNLIGQAEISDFKVVKAPSLARLIGILSLPGVASMLNGEGLAFTKLEADFDWLFRPRGSLLVVKNGRTSGNSLGLTFEGTFDNAASKIDVSGTIIPLSGVSNIISQIPLVGDILTGGSGGIFAATYKIKGEGKEPDVSVNPLSVLAPGILRRILFESTNSSIPEKK